jgi:pimeloyl-ACP methyl ester carboxylesterase
VAYSINGLHYHTWQWGPTSGPAALLLHGWMDAGASFQLLADALPGHWRLIAPDWRGFGRTAWAPGGYWFADYLADLDGLLQHLAPDAPVLLIGHSMGGNIAGLYAALAGVFLGMFPRNVDVELGYVALRAFPAVIVGGLESPVGAVVAGIILGVVENVGADFLDPLVGGGSRELIVAVVLILTVMIRPHGLFGRHDIERV